MPTLVRSEVDKRKRPYRRYFPNNLHQVNQIDPEVDLEPIPFSSIVERMNGWHLNPNVFMVARLHNKRTGSITEVGFLDQVTANRMMKKIMKSGDYEVTAVTETHYYELNSISPDANES